MSEHFRTLLDDAVSTVEPAHRDPVAAVVGRGRAARRRALGAGALALVVLAGGAVAAGERLGGGGEPAATVDVGEPPVPRLVGDTVVAGDVHLPVPPGWRVVEARAGTPCDDLKETVLIRLPGAGGCQTGAIEVSGTAEVNPMSRLVMDGTSDYLQPPSAYTLRGGAPAWLTEPVTGEGNDPAGRAAGAHYYNVLVVPWSKVTVVVRVSGPRQREIFESITVSPAPRAGRLVLPEPVGWAALVVPRAGDELPMRHAELTDARDIEALLQLLRAQQSTVDSQAACTSPAQAVATLRLSERRWSWVRPRAELATPVRPNPSTTIVMTFGDCREAVSPDGGRVRLSQETVDTLLGMFGLGAR